MKQLKRFCCILMMLLMVVSAAIIPAQAEHTHKWGSWQWSADCTMVCGQKYTQIRHCTVPGCRDTQDRYSTLNHKWSKWKTTNPTCTEAGKKTRKCSRCGKTQKKTIAALGHDWGDWYVLYAPVGATPGMEERECKRCHITEQREIPGTPLPADPVPQPEQHPALSVELVSATSPSQEGDNVTSVWRVTNTGDTDLCYNSYRFHDGDGKWMGSGLSHNICGGETSGYLHPGDWCEVEIIFTVNSDDASLGIVKRTFTAVALVPYAPDEIPADGSIFSTNEVSDSASLSLPLDVQYSLVVKKTVISTAVDPSGAYAEGENIEYRITVTNPNSVPVRDVQIHDYLIIGEALGYYPILAPGETVSVEATYTVQDTDADIGAVLNDAVAFGYVNDELVENSDEVVVQTLPRIYRIEGSLVKSETSSAGADGYYHENDTITYAITLTNNSKFSWDSVEFYDSQVGGVLAVTYDMAPGDSVTILHSYTVSNYDAEVSGAVHNTAYSYVSIDERHRSFTSNTVVSPCGPYINPDPPFEAAGEDCCERVLTGCGDGSSYELHFCATHAPAQAYELQILEGVTDPALKALSYTLATASRQTDADALYELILARAGRNLKSAVLKEKLDFTAMMANFTAMAAIIYPDAPDTAAWLVYRMWENKVVDLCWLLNKGSEPRLDLLDSEKALDVNPGSTCDFTVTAADDESEAYIDALCDAHAATNRLCMNMISASATGWKSAAVTWQQDGKALYSSLLKGKTMDQRQIMAETGASFESWLTAQAEMLSLFYPDAPATVSQLTCRSRMEWIMNLCK